jgi:hypothetical protein
MFTSKQTATVTTDNDIAERDFQSSLATAIEVPA